MNADQLEGMPENYEVAGNVAFGQNYDFDRAEAEREQAMQSIQQWTPGQAGIPGQRSNTSIYIDPNTGAYTNMPTTTDMVSYSGPDIMRGGWSDAGGGGGSIEEKIVNAAMRGVGGNGPQALVPAASGSSGPGYYEQRENRLNAEWAKDSAKIWGYHSPPSTQIVGPAGGGGMTGSGTSGIPQRGQVSWSTPTMEMPTSPTPETFVLPQVDEAKIRARIQEIMAPTAARLKGAVRDALAKRRYGSPTLDRYVVEGAMSGYGQGLADIQGKANQAGRSAYLSQEYGPSVEAAKMNWQSRVQNALQNWQAQLQNYINTMEKRTETYTPEG